MCHLGMGLFKLFRDTGRIQAGENESSHGMGKIESWLKDERISSPGKRQSKETK